MNLVFITLEVEHFRCFVARQVFRLSPSPGLWFLRGTNEVEPQLGSNGSGKSSLFEALCWLLFGRTSQGLKNTDIKPWQGKGVPKVTLHIEIDGTPHTITRTAKTNGLQIDGKEVGPEEAAKLVGLSFDVLINTLFLAQGQPLFFDRTPKEKLQLFTDVLPLERWEERSDRAAKRVKELSALESEMNGELVGLRTALEQNAALLKRAQEDSAAWQQEQEGRAERATAEIKVLEGQLETQQLSLNEVDLAHDGAWTKLREMRGDLGKLQAAVDAAQQKVNAAENEQQVIEREIERLRKELQELGEADNCPVCAQPIKGTGFGKHKTEVKRKVTGLEQQLTRFLPEELTEALDEAMDTHGKFLKGLRLTEQRTDELQSRLNMLNPSVGRLQAQITAAKDTLRERQGESNPYVDQVQGLRRQKSKLETEIGALEADVIKAQQQIERVSFWVKGFKDVALYLIEEVTQELEAVTNSILGEVGLAGWQVLYDIERETKSGTVQRGVNVTVVPPKDYIGGERTTPIKWESWSGGESQRLRLVGALALSEVLLSHAGVNTNLEVFDEPGKYISGAGINDLCKYLSDRAKTQGKTVWLIDHLVREGAVFAGTTGVRKTAKGSIVS